MNSRIAPFTEADPHQSAGPGARGLSRRAVAATLALLTGAGVAACGRTAGPPPASAIGGPFVLTDQNGSRRTEAMLKGKWSLVFFGYTFCPDVCPVTLAKLGAASEALGSRAGAVQVVFVTVDPARDTPAQLKTYLSSPSFPPGTIGLTGTDSQVAGIAKAFHVYYRKAGAGPGYSVDHTSVVYLMDPDGRFDRPVDVSGAPAAVAGQITAAMHGERGS